MKRASADSISIHTKAALQDFAKRLDLKRRSSRITVEQLCLRAGCSRTTYARLMNAEPGIAIGTIAEFMNILGCLNDLNELAAPERDQHLAAKLNDMLPVRVSAISDKEF